MQAPSIKVAIPLQSELDLDTNPLKLMKLQLEMQQEMVEMLNEVDDFNQKYEDLWSKHIEFEVRVEPEVQQSQDVNGINKKLDRMLSIAGDKYNLEFFKVPNSRSTLYELVRPNGNKRFNAKI